MGVDQQAPGGWHLSANVNLGQESAVHISRLNDALETRQPQRRDAIRLILAYISIAVFTIAGLALLSGHEGRPPNSESVAFFGP